MKERKKMNNRQYYKCDRNNYFFGKLMTVRDFENEQTYINSKRRLGNRMLGGVGIISGLNVVLVDNKTISLESGLAFDYLGREIVVPESIIKKLDIIKGFDENKDKGVVYLCIEYKEELKETTFSVAGAGKSSGVSEEFNRVSEGYELFLTSDEPKIGELKIDSLINRHFVIYNQNNVKISLTMHKYVGPNAPLKISVKIEKENVVAPLKCSFEIGGEFFETQEGDENLTVEYQETEVTTFKNVEKEYKLYCNATAPALAELFIKKESFKIQIGSDAHKVSNDIVIPISIKTEKLSDLIIDDYYLARFDEIINDVDEKRIYLAKFNLVTNELTYFIENFEKHPFKQYLFSNEFLRLLTEIENMGTSNFSNNSNQVKSAKKSNVAPAPQVMELPEPKIDNVTTGVERINLGFNPRVGKSYYSYEFAHGLGEGNIGVITAIDNKANYLTDDKGLLVFGDKSIFEKEEISITAPSFQIAAVVNAEKGTLKIGIRLLEKTPFQAVDVRWWAIKPVEIQQEEEDLVIDENVRVVITPNTTRVKPLEQARFEAKIEGASSQEVRWFMAENNTGTIDNNGLYTAPSKEGVYEVKAQSVKFEGKSDSAYVVVSSFD